MQNLSMLTPTVCISCSWGCSHELHWNMNHVKLEQYIPTFAYIVQQESTTWIHLQNVASCHICHSHWFIRHLPTTAVQKRDQHRKSAKNCTWFCSSSICQHPGHPYQHTERWRFPQWKTWSQMHACKQCCPYYKIRHGCTNQFYLFLYLLHSPLRAG